MLVTIGIVSKPERTSFENVTRFGSGESPVSNEGRGDAAVVEASRSAGGDRWVGWHLGAAVRGFNPDSVFGVLPSSDLRRVEPQVGKRTMMGQIDDASARSEMLGETGAASVACMLLEARVGGGACTLIQGIAKEKFWRRLVPRVTVILGHRLGFAPRDFRIVEMVARSRVAGLTNSDTSQGAVTGGVGRTDRKAGAQPKGIQQEPPRQA